MSGPFTEMAKIAEYFDSLPLKHAMASVEASKFIGEDGKEYIRFPLAMTPTYKSGCPILPESDD